MTMIQAMLLLSECSQTVSPWWKEAGIDPIAVARKLWGQTRRAEGRHGAAPTNELSQSPSDQDRLLPSVGTAHTSITAARVRRNRPENSARWTSSCRRSGSLRCAVLGLGGSAPNQRGEGLADFDAATGARARTSCRRRWSLTRQRRLAGGSNGFSTSAPKPATSATLRVANVIRCILAVAARSASTVGSGRMVALMLPHSSATIWSMGRIRSPYDCLSVDSHFSSARA